MEKIQTPVLEHDQTNPSAKRGTLLVIISEPQDMHFIDEGINSIFRSHLKQLSFVLVITTHMYAKLICLPLKTLALKFFTFVSFSVESRSFPKQK